MRHSPITIGTAAAGGSLSCADPILSVFLAVPEFACFIASCLEERAAQIESGVEDEVRDEIVRNVDRTYATDTYAAGLDVDNSEAEALVLEAVTTEDQVAKKELLLEAQRLREQNRLAARQKARDAARSNALEREFDRLGRKDRESQRERNRDYAQVLRDAASQIRSGKLVREEVAATSWALDRQACIFGAIGSGKTRLALHLIEEQLRAGCSLLAIDPKSESVRDLISCAISAGVAPEDVILIKPGEDASIPGWNPFLSDDPPDETARAMHSFFQEITDLRERMDELMRNALTVVATHRLSLQECRPLIASPTYRRALLEREPPGGPNRAYRQAIRYFQEDFLRRNESGREETIQAVNNRLNALLDVPFFSALLCAGRNTLDLAELWSKQKVVIVYLDQQRLGYDGSRIVGGLLAYQAYLTAMKIGADSPLPVVLALDEIGAQEKFLGQYLSTIVTVARSHHLRLLIATQDFSRISSLLLKALIKNAQFRAFFQLGEEDAREVSATFAARTEGNKGGDRRLELSAEGTWEEWEARLCDPDGFDLTVYELTVEEVPFIFQPQSEQEVGYDDLTPPCPEPISIALAPKPPVFTPLPIPPATLHKIQTVERLRLRAEQHNKDIQNQSISRSSYLPTLIRYGYATFDERKLDNGSTEYRFYELNGTKREENWFELQLEKILSRGHAILHGASRTRKPLTDKWGMTESSDLIVLTPDDLEWKRKLDEYNSKEGERRAAVEKYNADVVAYQTQVYQRNEEINQWRIAAAALLKKIRKQNVKREEKRYQDAVARHAEAVADAQTRSENVERERQDEIRRMAAVEFSDYPLLADLYIWLRTTYASEAFHIWTDADSHTDLAGLLRELFLCGLPSSAFQWRTNPDQDIFAIQVPSAAVMATDEFNPATKAEWEKALITMPSRHAAVWTTPGEAQLSQAAILRVVDVPDALPENTPQFQAYLRRAREANSQSEGEVTTVELWREEQINRLSTPSAEEPDKQQPMRQPGATGASKPASSPRKTGVSSKHPPSNTAAPPAKPVSQKGGSSRKTAPPEAMPAEPADSQSANPGKDRSI